MAVLIAFHNTRQFTAMAMRQNSAIGIATIKSPSNSHRRSDRQREAVTTPTNTNRTVDAETVMVGSINSRIRKWNGDGVYQNPLLTAEYVGYRRTPGRLCRPKAVSRLSPVGRIQDD